MELKCRIVNRDLQEYATWIEEELTFFEELIESNKSFIKSKPEYKKYKNSILSSLIVTIHSFLENAVSQLSNYVGQDNGSSLKATDFRGGVIDQSVKYLSIQEQFQVEDYNVLKNDLLDNIYAWRSLRNHIVHVGYSFIDNYMRGAPKASDFDKMNVSYEKKDKTITFELKFKDCNKFVFDSAYWLDEILEVCDGYAAYEDDEY
ncbi:hypothetical protein [Saccharibacillus sp. WB 17]|uniref:hypothetical protein n=1 Tax=Saccharibacillus sp. WB 17 TaxID=2603535 RepID=UPI001238B1B0|nr:hypothetical protein [Saccharibacillus sp. WB 17]MWJ30596.1 hypothetical protein [Saccharibacillus sp. WB 17]